MAEVQRRDGGGAQGECREFAGEDLSDDFEEDVGGGGEEGREADGEHGKLRANLV